MKKVVLSVTNDLVTDQRVKRSIGVLREMGCEITLVGRLLPQSLAYSPPFAHRRMKLFFKKGFLFYAEYNLRLFFFLAFRRYDLYFSNDLDTLLPNTLMARLRGKPLVYDSHEFFTGAPEIQDRPLVKGIWRQIEKFCYPQADLVITVNQSIARLLREAYGGAPVVVRNIGDSYLPDPLPDRESLGLPKDDYLLINQGAGINVHRGMEELIEALHLLPPEVKLVLVGKGDVVPALKAQVKTRENLQGRVIFIPPQSYERMLCYTMNADLGISLDKGNNPNYQFSLPNKLFDYIKSGIPVLVSPVIEVRKIVEHYKIGRVTDHRPENIAKAVKEMRQQGKQAFRQALKLAAEENNWEKERQKLREALRPFL